MPFNAWCELVVGSLSGRCPWIRVGLPNTNLQEKGTDSSCSTWTPSSLHSTSWWTTSATLIHQPSALLAQRLPSPKARSLPLLSSPGGPDSLASGTSTATPAATCEKHSPPCPSALSSTALCASTRSSSRRWPCTWQKKRRWKLATDVLTKL